MDTVDASGHESRFPNRLAQYVATELDRRGWSNREAGRHLKLSHVTIANLIYGETRYPDESTLAKLARLRGGVSAEDLMRWHREPAEAAADPPRAATLPVGRPVEEDAPAWVQRLIEAYEHARSAPHRVAHAGRPPGLPDQGDADALERVVVAAEGYENIFSLKVTSMALSDRRRPVLPGDTIWLDPVRPAMPGRAVGVVHRERLLLRTVAADGVTLHSADTADAPLRLDQVDRVVGVMPLFQVTEP